MELLMTYDSPLGTMTFSSDGMALTGLRFNGQKYFPAFPEATTAQTEIPLWKETKTWLDIYFSGAEPPFTPPLLFWGTPFQKTVWELILRVPYGKTVSYGELAKLAAAKTGKIRMSARAVGTALGHNPVLLIAPCHRVIRADGSLGGYAAGLERKEALLKLEDADFSGTYGGMKRETPEHASNSRLCINSLDRSRFFPYNSKSEEGEQ